MCPCDPNDNTLNPKNLGPPPNIPGFGASSGPHNLFPPPDFELPPDMPPDVMKWVKKFFALFPSNKFTSNPDDTAKSPLQEIMKILSQITPYLGLYKFFMALLNMVMCILDVLCSLVTKVTKALKKLFKQCIPDFLNLFPWLALILMIIALILLLIAIIEYIIFLIIKFIKDIIKNLKKLSKAVQDADTESVLIIAQKISNILCMFQGFLAVLIALEAIWAIVRDLSKMGGRLPCDDSESDAGCCANDVCPPFIKNNPDGISGNLGNLRYYKSVGVIFPPPFDTLGLNFNIRNESWQFYDDTLGKPYHIDDIITPTSGATFWPEGLSFDINSSIKKIPYTVDMTMEVDPAIWNPGDVKGKRKFFFKDVFFINRPYHGVYNYNNSIETNHVGGTAPIAGGLVYEADKTTPYLINGTQATLNTFIHKDPFFSGSGLFDDGYQFTNIEYTWKPNNQALMEYTLITAGCLPDLAKERVALAAQYADLANVAAKVTIPDILGAYNCIATAIDNFRKNISEDNALVFQAECSTCLNNLRDQAFNAYKQAVNAGFSPFSSTLSLDTNLQFVNSPIQVKVTLKDPTGNPLNLSIPTYSTEGDIAKEIAQAIVAEPTLGTVGEFTYDGVDSFTATLNSSLSGDGTITVSYKDNKFKNIINRDNLNITTAIIDNVLSYTFIGGVQPQPEPRRDVGDIARDAFNNIG